VLFSKHEFVFPPSCFRLREKIKFILFQLPNLDEMHEGIRLRKCTCAKIEQQSKLHFLTCLTLKHQMDFESFIYILF